MEADSAESPSGDTHTIRVVIIIFDDVEVLDFCGPFEVFTVASRVRAREAPDAPRPFDVETVSVGPTTRVRARGGLRVTADERLATHTGADLVIVPGGIVTAAQANADLLLWLRSCIGQRRTVASICNGAFILASAGLLNGRTVTTHWEDVAQLRLRFPKLVVIEDARYLDHGPIATAAGVSAGIDLALHYVMRFAGKELAVKTARQMDYPWTPSPLPWVRSPLKKGHHP
ncbi:MAG: DJ-1/PfpI family protein [Actinomycetota bacterium]|nr:DJ-1/PfpI family protein [Actinomycetota bacterium]